MKKAIVVSALLVFVMFTVAYGFGDAFRCGSRLITIGDSKGKVMACCGEPDFIDTEGTVTDEVSQKTGTEKHTVGSTTIIEAWTYNRGPGQFVRILRFSGSRLVSIGKGDYGW